MSVNVGDIIAVYDWANKLRKRFINAPILFKGVAADLKSLAITVQEVDLVLEEWSLSDHEKTLLGVYTKECRNVLAVVEEKVESFTVLENPSSLTASATMKRVWKRLNFDPDEINSLRHQITSSITLLNSFYGRIASQRSSAVLADLGQLSQRLDDKDRRDLANWLTPVDHAIKQNKVIAEHQKGTGQWLLNSDEVQKWINRDEMTLFCPGIPGAGKTTLTAILIQHLWNLFPSGDNFGIAYLYCDYGLENDQKPIDLLASLLKQLIQEQPSMPESVRSLHQIHSLRRTRPSFEEISNALHSVAASYSRTLILIDGLDEYELYGSSMKPVLSEVFKFQQAGTAVSLFATSTDIPAIRGEFKKRLSLTIRAKNDDVQRYLEGRMLQLRPFVLGDPALQEEIKAGILGIVDGMFLLARLLMDSMSGKLSRSGITGVLERFQKQLAESDNGQESKLLDLAYVHVMEQIENQQEGLRELATNVLKWVTCAKRPLTLRELRYALAVEVGRHELDKGNLTDSEDIISVCAGLIIVDGKGETVRFVHRTAQDYFNRIRKSHFSSAEADIAKICVTYLSFDGLNGLCSNLEEFDARLQLNPLYDYAARYWGDHARAASIAGDEMILGLLQKNEKICAISQAMLASKGNPSSSQRVPKNWTGMHLAAYSGLHDAIAVLRKDHAPDLTDTYGRTPLAWAADRGFEDVVQWLLSTDCVEPDSRDSSGRTPLSHAAARGHEEVVRLLLANESVERDAKDDNCRTPLSWSARYGKKEVVKLLLEKDDGVLPDSADQNGRTPLAWAATNGHLEVVELLLADRRVDPNSKDWKYERTPLSRAAWNGHTKVVESLLARATVEPNPKDHGGWTPLSLAAAAGHAAVVGLLLKRAVDPDSEDNAGVTPLSWAARQGREAVVKMLLDLDQVRPDSKDEIGRTPLLWATTAGASDVVDLLVQKYEQKGLAIRDEDLKLPADHPAASRKGIITCNICRANIPDADTHYNCEICSDGDFDICNECSKKLRGCGNECHRLVQRKVKDRTLII